MTDLVEAGHKDYSTATFCWYLINTCQYRCTYCSVDSWLLQRNFDKKYHTTYKSVIKRLSLNKMSPFIVEVLGGEPTLHPNIGDILIDLNKLKGCRRIELITNLAKPISFFKQFDILACNKVEITPSYHPEYHKRDRYLDKLIHLSRFHHIQLRPNITISDKRQHWNDTIYILDQLIEAGIRFSTNKLYCTDTYKTQYPGDVDITFKKYFLHGLGDGASDVIGNGEVYDRIPYVFKDKTEMLSDSDIMSDNLQRFKGYHCTPMYWDIHPSGAIINSCTGEALDPTGSNLRKGVKCPVPDGCAETEKFRYYKTKV